MVPATICSSLEVGVPGRTENAAISFLTWLVLGEDLAALSRPGRRANCTRAHSFWFPFAQREYQARRETVTDAEAGDRDGRAVRHVGNGLLG